MTITVLPMFRQSLKLLPHSGSSSITSQKLCFSFVTEIDDFCHFVMCPISPFNIFFKPESAGPRMFTMCHTDARTDDKERFECA